MKKAPVYSPEKCSLSMRQKEGKKVISLVVMKRLRVSNMSKSSFSPFRSFFISTSCTVLTSFIPKTSAFIFQTTSKENSCIASDMVTTNRSS